jgi:hypothetical protein
MFFIMILLANIEFGFFKDQWHAWKRENMHQYSSLFVSLPDCMGSYMID